MSDYESDDEQLCSDENVLNKYKMAAEVTNRVLTELIAMCVPGVKIMKVCEYGDNRILEETAKLFKKEKELKKGIAFPTCISVNHIVCHYSPIESEDTDSMEIHDEDLIKIDLGCHVDGFVAVVGHTVVLGEKPVSGRKADVVLAANVAAEASMRLLRPGIENFKVTDMLRKATQDYNCKLIEGTQCHLIKRHVYDAEKNIVFNPTDEQRKVIEKCSFEQYEAWIMDVTVSSGEGKPKEYPSRTSVYRKNETLYQLKMKASRQFYSEIANKFLAYPFNLRGVEDIKKARLGVTECAKHNVVQPLPVLCEKDNEFVAQFKFTVLLMPNGPMRITGLPFDQTQYKSDFKIKDSEVKELLSQSIKTSGGKKKKKATQ